LIVPKDDAKKDGADALKPDRDIKPSAATGTKITPLKLHLAKEYIDTLWLPDGLGEDETNKRIEAVIALFNGIEPQGTVEEMLATQMVAAHSAAMDCLRWAMLKKQTFEGREQNLKHAAKFMSIYTHQLEVLDKHRGKGQQKVTVEYVNVEPGGQAIVGHVEAGGRRKRKRRKGPATPAMTPAIDHSPEVPLEIPDPVVRQRTPQKVPQKVRRGR